MKKYRLEELCLAVVRKKIYKKTTSKANIYDCEAVGRYVVLHVSELQKSSEVTAIDGTTYYKDVHKCVGSGLFIDDVRAFAAALGDIDISFDKLLELFKANKKITALEILAVQEKLNRDIKQAQEE